MTTSTKPPLDTNGFAAAIRRSAQTIRAKHCHTGEAYGITPIKLNGRLLWPADQVEALIKPRGNTKSEAA